MIQRELPKPDLDDKTFAQLVEEAVKLIPRFAPQWTDHNLSDPGITVIDLFAWLTETTLYRLNLITDKHRMKYLKLLGFSPQPPAPARVDLTFDFDKEITLNKGMAVSAEVSGNDVRFELSEDITITPVTLKKIIVDELTGGVFDRTAMNEQSDLFYAPFGLDIRKDCALYLGFDNAAAALNFMCYLYEKDLISPGKHGEEPDYDFSNSKLTWAISVTGGNWKSVTPVQDGTKGFKRSGRLVFKDLKDWTSEKIYVSEEKLFWLRCAMEESFFEYPPRIETIRLNTVTAMQGLTVTEKDKWTGNGLPGQGYILKRFPVIKGTVELLVDGSKWQERDDLDGSRPYDKHYVMNGKSGEILFGDGLTGSVPPAGSMIEAGCYRTCDGESGNVMSDSEWKIESLSDLKIKNYRPAAGGTEAESIDDAVYRFIKDLQTSYTTVTSSDFEYIAVNTPGLRIAKAKAIPEYHPDNGKKTGCVTVVVIPFTPLEFFVKPPYPSDGFKQAVCRHLDRHRLICTEISVAGPLYVKVAVNLTVVLSGGFNEGEVIDAVIKRLNRFIHPITGGEGRDGWPVGRSVFRSEIYNLIEDVDGVKCITKLFLSGDGGSTFDGEGNLLLPSETATVYSGRHSATVLKESEECKKRRKDAAD